MRSSQSIRFFDREVQRGAGEAEREEERLLRLVLTGFKQLDRLGGADAVGLLVVVSVGGEPAQRPAERAAVGVDGEDPVLVDLVAAVGVDDVVP